MSTSDKRDDPIAVIGMTLRVPGAADVQEFWENLRSGRESIDRADPLVTTDGARTMVHAVGRIAGAADFDARHFGMTDREAEITDPQQRIFLECAAEVLERSGYLADSEYVTGVIAGQGQNSYILDNVMSHDEFRQERRSLELLIAGEKDHLATRVAHRLGLTGPSFAVQSSCSTSLTAVHLASGLLRRREADLMLAGGVSLDFSSSYEYQIGGILSDDGVCRPFDASAAGTLPGSGCGVIVLKRLADAERDRDEILAVLRGSGMSNDGRAKVGYSAPSAAGQERAIRKALESSGIDPEDVAYVEGHGTGTALGDPIEVDAITRAYQTNQRRHVLHLGSVKANIGHVDCAAGVVGLIKAVLILRHRTIPPMPTLTDVCTAVREASNIECSTSVVELPATGKVTAGVSSFGVGGTNVHAIVQSYEPSPSANSRPSPAVIAVSADRADAFPRLLESVIEHAEHADIADLAYTLAARRPERAYRVTTVVSEDGRLDESGWSLPFRAHPRPTLVLLFPGHGTQRPGMLSAATEYPDVVSRTVAEVVENAGAYADDVRGYLRGDVESTSMPVEQISIFAVELALGRLVMDRGVRPSALIGHSIGELAAAALSGALEADDAVSIVVARAEVLGSSAAGLMLDVRLGEAEVGMTLPPSLDIAAVNAVDRTVVSGPLDAIADYERVLAEHGRAFRRLRVASAAHSRALEGGLDTFHDRIAGIRTRPPAIPTISTLTGEFVGADGYPDGYWVRQLREPVRYADALSQLGFSKEQLLIECGPGATLSATAQLNRFDAQTVSLYPEPGEPRTAAAQTLDAFGQIWCAGGPKELIMDWHGTRVRRTVPAPAHPLTRQRYWIDSAAQGERLSPMLELTSGDEDDLTPVETCSPAATGGAVADELRSLWQETLGHVEFDGGASFFGLGGDSLRLVRLRTLMQRKWGDVPPIRELAQCESFDTQVELVQTHLAAMQA